MNIKMNDTVVVIAGKDAGKQGKVLATFPKTNRVVVEGVNMVKKAQKARKANEVSKIVTKEAPIDASNVMIFCSACGKPVRVGHMEVEGKKVRVCVKCKNVLDMGRVSKKAAAAATEEAPKKRTRKRTAKKAEETKVEE